MNLIYNTPESGFDEVSATNLIRIILNAKMTSLSELEAVVVAVHNRMYRDESLMVETVTNLFVIAQIARWKTEKIVLQETGCAMESIIFLSAHGMPETANVSLSKYPCCPVEHFVCLGDVNCDGLLLPTVLMITFMC